MVIRLRVRVTPKSGQDEILGFAASELHVRVTSAPERGKANESVRELIAGALGISKSSVRIVRGETSRHKTLELDGIADEDVRRAFGEPDRPLF